MSSRSLNKITLIGNLTRDPELKYTPAGTAVCTFSVATNRSWTTQDGTTKEDVQYHRIVAWQKLAELCGKLLNKGRKIFLEGRLTYRTFVGKDTVQRTIAEIVLDDFIVFGDGRRPATTPEVKTETAPVVGEATVVSPVTTEAVTETVTEVKKEEAPVASVDENVNPDDIPF